MKHDALLDKLSEFLMVEQCGWQLGAGDADLQDDRGGLTSVLLLWRDRRRHPDNRPAAGAEPVPLSRGRGCRR